MSIKKPESGWNLRRITTHPGEMLLEEFMKPLGLSANRLALEIHVPATRIGDIINGRRGVSADTALRLSRYFETSPEFWLNLQKNYELSVAKVQSLKTIEKEVQPRSHKAA